MKFARRCETRHCEAKPKQSRSLRFCPEIASASPRNDGVRNDGARNDGVRNDGVRNDDTANDYVRHGARLILPLLFLIQSIASASPPKPTNPISFSWKQYRVKEVQGQVLAWEPWSSSWTPLVKGTDLMETTLLQILPDASVTIALSSREGFKQLNADSVEITFNHPAIVRLTDDMIRKVEMSSYFLPSLPDVLEGENKTLAKTQLYKGVEEAFQRFAAVMMPESAKSMLGLMGLKPGEEKADTEVGIHAKKLRLYSPRDGAILVSEKMPVEIKVSWQPVSDPKAKYEVRFWSQESTRPPPTAVTNLDYYVLRAYQEGDYLIQVNTVDGRYQSAVHRLHIAYPFSERIAGLNGRDQTPHPPLPLDEPPDDFVYVAKSLPVSLTFHWESGVAPTDKFDHFEIVLKDTAGKELFRRASDAQRTQLRFANSGEYRWHIEAVRTTATGTSERLYSEERVLKIFPVSSYLRGRDLATANPFDALLTEKSGVFFVDEGIE